MNKIDYLKEYYQKYDEDIQLWSRHGSVELLITMYYVEKYQKSSIRICDMGAGTGRYTHTLAKQGYTVDMVELVKYNINIFKRNIKKSDKTTIIQGNATRFSIFTDNHCYLPKSRYYKDISSFT